MLTREVRGVAFDDFPLDFEVLRGPLEVSSILHDREPGTLVGFDLDIADSPPQVETKGAIEPSQHLNGPRFLLGSFPVISSLNPMGYPRRHIMQAYSNSRL